MTLFIYGPARCMIITVIIIPGFLRVHELYSSTLKQMCAGIAFELSVRAMVLGSQPWALEDAQGVPPTGRLVPEARVWAEVRVILNVLP